MIFLNFPSLEGLESFFYDKKMGDFDVVLKECEFRYNFRNKNMYLYLLKLIRKNQIKLS